MLTNLLNDDCNKDKLDTASEMVRKEHKSSVKVELTCLSKQVSYHLRKGEHDFAEETLQKYAIVLSSINNSTYFKVMEQYLHSILERCKGNYERSYEIAMKCLEDLEKLPPCLISAAFYIQIAMLENTLAMKAKTREEMEDLLSKAEENYDTAIGHLNSQVPSDTKAEYEQKIYINKALLHLGSSITGEMLPDLGNLIDIKKAEAHLSKAHRLSKFRETQYLIAKALLAYRSCILKDALIYSEKATRLAEKCKFAEMITYAKGLHHRLIREQH